MRSGLRYRIAQRVGGAALDALLGTARFDIENEAAYRAYWQEGRPVIFVLWHGRLLPLGYLHRGQGVYGLASLSADGEYIARVLVRWGMPIVRGSSSDGASSVSGYGTPA